MKREEIRGMLHQWGLDRLKMMEHKEWFGNVANTEFVISATLAREAGLDLSAATFGPDQKLLVRQHWNFKERTPRRYFVFFVDADQSEPFLTGDGEFLSEEGG